MNDRGKDQLPAPPPASGDFNGWLASARGPALVIDPVAAHLIAANAKGALLLGLGATFDGRRVPLDSAMPAIMDLRRATARAQTSHGGATPLVFWTPAGIARLPCNVEIRASGALTLALVEIVVAADDVASPGNAPQRVDKAAARQALPETATGEEQPAGAGRDGGAHGRPAPDVGNAAGTPRSAESGGSDTSVRAAVEGGDRTARMPPAGPHAEEERSEARAQPTSPQPPAKAGDLALPPKHAPARVQSPPPTRTAPPPPQTPPATLQRERPRANAKPAASAAPPPPPQRSDDDTLKAIARQILAGRRTASAEPKPPAASPMPSERQARPNGTTVAAASHSSARDVRRSDLPSGPTDRETSGGDMTGSETSGGDPTLDSTQPDRPQQSEKTEHSEQPAATPSVAEPSQLGANAAKDENAAMADEARRSSMRRTLVRRMAHELKTPISAIVSAAEIMKDERLGSIGDERYLRYAHDIHESARHALAVIERMLGARQLDSGEAELSFTDVDINSLATAQLSGLETMAREAGLSLDSALAQRLPLVVADATSVRQIVLNLITNALKFTPRGGRVVLATAIDAERRLTLTVSDNGPGMNAGEVARVLGMDEPDEAAASSATSSRRGGGLGIGLPLVRQLAAANGATLEIACPIDGGTQVTLAFPTSRQVPV